MTEQSPSVRENKNQLLDDVYGRVTAAIAADRTRAGHPMDAAMVRALVDRGIFSPGDAHAGRPGRRRRRRRGSGGLRPARARPPELAAARSRLVAGAPAAWPSRRVAVLFVDGTMVDGPNVELPFGMGAFAGSDTLVAALEQCRRDPTIAAVVLRVNSPGGSAFASDVLAREIKKAARGRQADRRLDGRSGGLRRLLHRRARRRHLRRAVDDSPVRSACSATRSTPRSCSARWGSTSKPIAGARTPTSCRPTGPGPRTEHALAQQQIRHLYQLFVATVADGRRSRGLTAARVDELGRGHVWTGALAQGLGLVDRMGGSRRRSTRRRASAACRWGATSFPT